MQLVYFTRNSREKTMKKKSLLSPLWSSIMLNSKSNRHFTLLLVKREVNGFKKNLEVITSLPAVEKRQRSTFPSHPNYQTFNTNEPKLSNLVSCKVSHAFLFTWVKKMRCLLNQNYQKFGFLGSGIYLVPIWSWVERNLRSEEKKTFRSLDCALIPKQYVRNTSQLQLILV